MREEIETFERKFEELNDRTICLVERTGNDRLHSVRSANGKSIGEYIVRSAGAVEQMIGGITRRLWDDPFEWTLTERMQTTEAIIQYLDEVELSRIDGFLFFKSDKDLTKALPAPIEMRTLNEVLTNALSQAEADLLKAEELLASHAD